jgi:hypothetical protein
VREFWVASGHHLTRPAGNGWLSVTDDLLQAWLARPEILPPDEACFAERALHRRLRTDPRAPVTPGTVAALADPDARDNWSYFIAFRDRLLAAGTVEGAYLGIVQDGAALPPLFMSQLVQLILRNALDGCTDPFVLRAGELFFRTQRASVRDGALVLADDELVEEMEREQHSSPLTAMLTGGVEAIDLMSEANAWTYWSRSDAHAMALNFGGDAKARVGLATAIAAFLRHLLGLSVLVEPLVDVREADFRWYVGLDAEASAIGDALWRGETPAALDRLVGLFRLRIEDAGRADQRLVGMPVYLLLALTPDRRLRLKPQNLLVGLPLVEPATRDGAHA